MVEVGWQRITAPNMARSDETDLFTKENILKTVSNQARLFGYCGSLIELPTVISIYFIREIVSCLKGEKGKRFRFAGNNCVPWEVGIRKI